jgi:hypothetical protein
MFLRNVGIYLQVRIALLPRRTLKIEAVCSSETMVSTYKSAQLCYPEQHLHPCENVKFHKFKLEQDVIDVSVRLLDPVLFIGCDLYSDAVSSAKIE